MFDDLVKNLTKQQINYIRYLLAVILKESDFTLELLARHISDSLGDVQLPEETLRRFIHEYTYRNVRDEDGKKQSVRIEENFGSPKTLTIYLRFLIGEGVLSTATLDSKRIVPAALPQRLAAFISRDVVVDASDFDGLFQAFRDRVVDGETMEVRKSLSIEASPGQSYLDLAEMVEVYEANMPEDEIIAVGQISIGWAVFTHRDMLQATMKHIATDLLTCYVSVRPPFKSSSAENVVSFEFLQQYDPDTDANVREMNHQELGENLLEKIYRFQRVEEFSSEQDRLNDILKKYVSRDNDDVAFDREINVIGPVRRSTALDFDELKSLVDDERSHMTKEGTEKLGQALLVAALNLDTAVVRELLLQGAPVNFRDPESGTTALHIAASAADVSTVEVLLETNRCDHQIRDKQGRLPSELAVVFGDSMKLGERLIDLETAHRPIRPTRPEGPS